ncbi:MAG: peptidylprolyl isomerase [Actinomycetia bacterium]|nr:peptidylprolyl isomerase [Actinomycetes bacterium]
MLAAVALLGVACGGSDDKGSSSAGESTSTTAAAGAAFEYGTADCPPATPPAETPKSFDAAPKRCIEDGKDYGAVIATTEGTFTVDLAEDTAPGTVNNFVVLARWGWFDGDDFHRVVPGFVAQAGDRFGEPQGTGGPGYEIPDELPKAPYQKGSLAMANHGPDTGGSQWFVCDADCTTLPGDYPLFGQVTDGMDTVDKIMALGVSDGPPSKPIGITKVTITEK